MKHTIFQFKNYSSPKGFHIAKHTQRYHLLHFHDCIEFTILAQGQGTQVINGTEYHMSTYTFTIMDYKDCHSFYNLSSDNVIYNLMIPPSELSNAFMQKLDEITGNKICALSEEVGKIVLSLFNSLWYYDKSDQNYSTKFAQVICNNLLDLFLYNYPIASVEHIPLRETAIQKALMYINLHYTDPDLNLTALANHIPFNPCHLSELFHKKLGLTVKQYINFLRINHAKKQLRTTNDSIANICFNSGFSSVTSFNRNFFLLVGSTPSDYRILSPYLSK